MYFEVRTKRLAVTEKNTYKTVKELRLFEVENYTDAETTAHKYMGEKFAGEDLRIMKIAESKIQQVDFLSNECEMPFWKVKVNELHEKENGKIKRVAAFVVVQGETSAMAIERVDTLIRTWVVPTEIVKVELTKICEIIERPKESTAVKTEKPKKNKK